MNVLNHRVNVVTSSQHTPATDYRLYIIGDVHLGNAACNEKLLKSTIAKVAADPYGLVILLGDMIDGIGRANGDKRSRNKTLADWARSDDQDEIFEAEVDMAVKYLQPIADKVIGFVLGNHEDDVEKHGGGNVYWSMVDRLAQAGGKKPTEIALGYSGFINLRFAYNTKVGDNKAHVWSVTIFCHHGFGGGKLPGSQANNLYELMSDYDADLYFVGHTHKTLYVPKRIISNNGKWVKDTERHGFVCGSFLNSVLEPTKKGRPREVYSERSAMPPLPMGKSPVIVFHPRAEKMSLEKDL